MVITCTYAGESRALEFAQREIIIGRAANAATPDLDLSPDLYVSRHHARIFIEEGACWIEDLNSRGGVWMDGHRLTGPHPLGLSDTFIIGETTLHVEFTPNDLIESPPLDHHVPKTTSLGADQTFDTHKASYPAPIDQPTIILPTRLPAKDVTIEARLDAHADFRLPEPAGGSSSAQILEQLLELPMEFAAQSRLDTLLNLILRKAMLIVPGAQRSALLLLDPKTEKLLLKSYISDGDPSVSETLARQAMDESRGLIWHRSLASGDESKSLRRLEMETGMYAPMSWKGRALGAICVDHNRGAFHFTEENLRLFMAIAHYAALAVANHQLQENLQQNTSLLERLLANFSPRLRDKLLERARSGKLRPGGEKSQVTLLFSDLRGFTNTTAGMDADDVVEMLNDYFSGLVEAIFKHDGTIDKFMGDAILAVFGSPEADPDQHEKAVRAALAMQESIQSTNQRRASRGLPTCDIGIGIHSGEVLHGFIGTAERLEFTVIGEAVNRASRYCSGAGRCEVVISPEVFEHVFRLVQAEKTTIPTKHEGDLIAYRVRQLKN
ncbi:MAG: FHA domain-containing protein [Pedosphaera sp.]|nr:FHA domain-containing protein [Pedosphaera sp.]